MTKYTRLLLKPLVLTRPDLRHGGSVGGAGRGAIQEHGDVQGGGEQGGKLPGDSDTLLYCDATDGDEWTDI